MLMVSIKAVEFIAEAKNTLPNNGYPVADIIVGLVCFVAMYISAPLTH